MAIALLNFWHRSTMAHHRRKASSALLTVLAPAVLAAGCAPSDPVPSGRLVLSDITLIDGTGAPPRPGMALVIRDGRIERVVLAADLSLERGDSVVDGAGLFAVPGLWDVHVHLSKTKAEALPLLVAHGVTAVRDMGGDFEELTALRAEVDAGERVGPRMFVAGPMLEAPATLDRLRGSGTQEDWRVTRIPLPDSARARAVIDSLAALGVDFVKIREYAADDIYRTVLEAARSHGLEVAGHAPFTMDAEVGAALGVASFEHASYPYPLPEDASARPILDAFVRHGVAVVPTLVAWETHVMVPESLSVVVADAEGARDRRVPLLSDFLREEWRLDVEELGPRAEGYYEGFRGYLERQSADLLAMHRAGVPVLPGSDLAGIGLFPGWSLHREIELFVDWIGMTPMEAIESATRRSAELLGAADSLGTLEEGKVADVVLLEADPTIDIRNLRRIHSVVLRGEILGPERIRRLLGGLHPTYEGSVGLLAG